MVADSRQRLDDALEQRDGDDRLTEDEFDKTVDGLPKEALVKVGGDLQTLIASDPDTKAARARSSGSTRCARSGRRSPSRTTASRSTSSSAPTAASSPTRTSRWRPATQSPGVLDLPNEIGVGLRDPAQLFQLRRERRAGREPDQYADYSAGKAAAERRLGIDIDEDLIAQLEGDASLSVSTRGRRRRADRARGRGDVQRHAREAREGAAPVHLQHGRLADAAHQAPAT